MKISKSRLSRIIREERRRVLSEGGCGCGGSIEDIRPLPEYEVDTYKMFDDENDEHQMSHLMSKDESLKSVVAIAMATSCPVTRQALLSLVSEIME